MQLSPSPEESLRKPDLFVIGAMKSGTSFLSRQLGRHPSIFIPILEEPSYFVPPDQLRQLWPYMWEQGLWRSEEAYLRLFLPGKDAVILAEASTNYGKYPQIGGVAARIAQFNDAARFIYVMRDPIERTVSHYWHMVRFYAEHRTIGDAIRQNPQYLDVSNYAMQLAPYFACFGPERVFTLTFEELTYQTVATMRRLYTWLGVDPMAALSAESVEAQNATPDVVAMPSFLGALVRLRNARPVRAVVPHLPRMLRGAAKRMVTVEVERRHVDTSDVITYLRPIQQRQTQTLAAILGREFPEWKTLYGDVTTSTTGTPPERCGAHA
jgi:hypothetical protein